MRAAIFIDGGYFLKQMQEARITPDYGKLVGYFLQPLRQQAALDLMRCYFYYCPPYMSSNPSDAEKRRMAQYERFVADIEDIERWQFREGKLEKRREGDRDIFSQKRVDVLLSVDMVRHAAAGHIQHAVLVAGDSDFIPAVIAAKESGVTLTLWCGKDRSPHKDLMVESDDVQFIDLRRIPSLTRAVDAGEAAVVQVGEDLAAPTPSSPEKPRRATGARKRPAAGGARAARADGNLSSPSLKPPESEPAVIAASNQGAKLAPAVVVSETPGDVPASDVAGTGKKKTRRGRRGGRGRRKTTEPALADDPDFDE